MRTKDPHTKAKKWFIVVIIAAVTLTFLNNTIQILTEQGVLNWNMSILERAMFLLIPAFFLYFLPLLRVRRYATEANRKPLLIISKILIIHFYCTLVVSTIILIVYLFT